MPETPLRIRSASIQEVAELYRQTPEFQTPYPIFVLEERLGKLPQLLLLAEWEGQPAGYKIGYQRGGQGEFYSWLGGVLPPFRRKGIGNHLAAVMETLAAEAGFSHIWFKTRNRYPEMIRLGIRRGYQIVKLEIQPNVMDHRIFLRKPLKGS